jgi:hypothetical protein
MVVHDATRKGADYIVNCLYTYLIYQAFVLKFGGKNMVHDFLFQNFLPYWVGGGRCENYFMA